MDPTTFGSLVHELTTKNITTKVYGDLDWGEWSTTYNRHVPVTPAVVVCPDNTVQICAAVTLARKYGMKVQARSGGHSYASHSNGGVDGAMVIDLRQLNGVNDFGASAHVQAGTRLGNMAQTIYERSGHALPHGTCAGVGVGGHFTHGGFGFFSRAWGLAMDRITGLDVITAEGEDVHVSETDHPDLYYAMRGAADSFGIVHLFYLSPTPAPQSVVHWSVKIPGVVGHVQSSVKAFQYIQDFVHNETIVNRELGLNLSLARDYFAIDGTYLGSSDRLGVILSKLLQDLVEASMIKTPATVPGPPKVETEIKQMSWLDSLKILNQGQSIRIDPKDPKTYDKHDNFFAKSVVLPEPGFNKETLTSFFTYLLNIESPISSFILIDLWGGADSQINTKDCNFSAFAHRDACWVTQVYGSVSGDQPLPKRGIEYVNGLVNSMTQHLERSGAYANYTDASLTREEAHEQYYGQEVYAKLKQAKETWDPDNVFSNPHSI
ncbi:putative glucooligosaccharide oxidase [Hypoxylon cercidicola]|nr:putative glucooligosaccharide oxidase [Hypoxylon cercidicola]